MNAELTPDPAALWLCQLPGMTPALALHLVATCGSAAAIMQTSSSKLRELGVTPTLVANIVAGPRHVQQIAAGLKGLQRLGIVPLPLVSSAYPQRLRALAQPPLVVYVQGRWPLTQPLIVVVEPPELEARIGAAWLELARGLQPHIGLVSMSPDINADAPPPALLGVPYGLMLARQRLAQGVWKHVANGATTLISTCPPAVQSDQAGAQMLLTTLVALADAVVVLMPAAPELDIVLVAARSAGVPVYAFGAAPRAPLPSGMRRLRAGKPGIRTLSTLLGVHLDGPDAIQQERLF